ncbi:hypothetical protein F383_15317 [Gossypium arboreum]|uniref:Uncharacterized protein n=1 Tax=Gossypium arboreum TaxID=29729 RepID=A0A0B0Q324_GOSAR|nr:hypothetical protein F383_15317 [Gossypium arboreum]
MHANFVCIKDCGKLWDAKVLHEVFHQHFGGSFSFFGPFEIRENNVNLFGDTCLMLLRLLMPYAGVVSLGRAALSIMVVSLIQRQRHTFFFHPSPRVGKATL